VFSFVKLWRELRKRRAFDRCEATPPFFLKKGIQQKNSKDTKLKDHAATGAMIS